MNHAEVYKKILKERCKKRCKQSCSSRRFVRRVFTVEGLEGEL